MGSGCSGGRLESVSLLLLVPLLLLVVESLLEDDKLMKDLESESESLLVA